MGDAGAPVILASPADLPSIDPTKSYWQTSHPTPIANHRSTASLPSKATAVIVGTGISGVFATHELLSKSTDVDILVLEARTVCSGATGRNGGHLVPLVHEQRPGIIAWELRNCHHVEGIIESEKIPCDLRKLNSCIGFWNKTYFEEAKEALKEATILAPEQTGDIVRVVEDENALKELNLINAVGALVQTTAASLSPYMLVTWLWQDLLKKHEGTRLNLQTTTPVTSISQSQNGQGYLVTTDRGTVHADHIILATNGYTSHLLPEFTNLISPRQAQMSAQAPPKDSPFSKNLIPRSYGFLGMPGADREMSDYLVQKPILPDSSDDADTGGELMFGGGRQCARNQGVFNGDDSYVDPDVEKYLRGLPERLNLYPDSDTATAPKPLDLVASWTGIIGSSIDGHPWIGGVPDHPGLFLCAGYSGHGMPNASLSGRHVARLVLESLKGGDWAHLQRREVEATEKGHATNDDLGVPFEYVITKERIEKALGKA